MPIAEFWTVRSEHLGSCIDGGVWSNRTFMINIKCIWYHPKVEVLGPLHYSLHRTMSGNMVFLRHVALATITGSNKQIRINLIKLYPLNSIADTSRFVQALNFKWIGVTWQGREGTRSEVTLVTTRCKAPLMSIFNTLKPRQDGHHFPDDILKWIFLNENVWISIEISLKFVPKGQINNIPGLVQIMAWCVPGDKPLSEPMMVSLLTHICVTRPQWVKKCRHCIYVNVRSNAITFKRVLVIVDATIYSKIYIFDLVLLTCVVDKTPFFKLANFAD